MNEIKKILIIRLSALGDTIHTLPTAYAVRRKYPEAQIDWVVEDKAEKFVRNNPLLNKVYVIRKKRRGFISILGEYIRVLNEIKKENYDIVIDTQQLLKSAVIAGFSGCKRRISLSGGREFSGLFVNEIIETGRKQFDTNYHVVKRNLEIAAYLGCEVNDIKFVIPDLENEISDEIKRCVALLDRSRKTIVIAPATTWENKHWNVSGWIGVINEFKNECNIIITASEKEKSRTTEILSRINGGNITDLTGKTTLSDLTFLYKNVDVVVSPDSGSAHIAWACNSPGIVTLFFATSANRTAPFGERYYSLSSKASCAPCMKKHCAHKNNKNGCCTEINPNDVINMIKKVLNY